MKWKKEQAQRGDRKIVRRFAWFPKEVEDHTVWLETYQTELIYYGNYHNWGFYWQEEVVWKISGRRVYPGRKLLYTAY
jgi:hypothetical protein